MESVVYLFVLFAGVVTLAATSEWTTEDCWELGFNKANLLCNSCDRLGDFGQRQEVRKSSSRSVWMKIGTLSTARGKKPKQFPTLTIKYVRGADPIIKLQNEDGDTMEELAVDKWNTDSVEEFLRTYLDEVELNEL
ncbi:hypothetical protein CHUAL_008137 [Chamberlinius hualienensis]